MKGVIFNILEEFILDGWGREAFEDILLSCPVHMHEGHVAPGTYADADMVTIVQKTCERLKVSPADALTAFGRFMFPRLVARYPQVVEGISDPYQLLEQIDDVIHVEVCKLMPDAVTPRVRCEPMGDSDEMTVRYQSSRKLCEVFAGLLQGVGEQYGRTTEYRQLSCMHEGSDCCVFKVRFPIEESGI